MSSHIFVDETKRAGYVIAAVTVSDTDAIRTIVRARAARSAADPHEARAGPPSAGHRLGSNAAGKTSLGRGRGNGAVLDGAVALKIDLTANGCSVVPQPR